MTDLSNNAKEKLQSLYEQRDGLLCEHATKDGSAIRKHAYEPKLFRRQFIRDCEVVINLPLFNRYAGKTQVFSLSGNDDVSTRAYHVQLVSRIARTIGSALSLNLDLIEAIALAHDLGHCPFGHLGEKLLDNVTAPRGYRFAHHAQGARYLNDIVNSNLSLQVVDGVLCHNGEKVLQCYAPNSHSCKSFADLEDKLELAYNGQLNDGILMASTLEGCLVRIADVIAYVGKDRQDAQKLKVTDFGTYERNALGKFNHEIIANLSIDIINNSLGKGYIALSDSAYEELNSLMRDNYAKIYNVSKIDGYTKEDLQKIVSQTYDVIYADLTGDRKLTEKYYRPYIYPNTASVDKYFANNLKYPERMSADFIASMSDRYLLTFHKKITQLD